MCGELKSGVAIILFFSLFRLCFGVGVCMSLGLKMMLNRVVVGECGLEEIGLRKG